MARVGPQRHRKKTNTYEPWTGYPIVADIRTLYITSVMSLTNKREAQFVMYCTSSVFEMPTGIQVMQITWLKVSACCILYLLVFTLWSLCVTSMVCADNSNCTLYGDIVWWILFLGKWVITTWSWREITCFHWFTVIEESLTLIYETCTVCDYDVGFFYTELKKTGWLSHKALHVVIRGRSPRWTKTHDRCLCVRRKFAATLQE